MSRRRLNSSSAIEYDEVSTSGDSDVLGLVDYSMTRLVVLAVKVVRAREVGSSYVRRVPNV